MYNLKKLGIADKDQYRIYNMSTWGDYHHGLKSWLWARHPRAHHIRFHLMDCYGISSLDDSQNTLTLNERINYRGHYWWKQTHDAGGNRF